MTVDSILMICASMVVIGFAAFKGSQPERIAAAILGLSMLVDILVLLIVGYWDFSVFNSSRLMLDLLELGLLLTLALRANRVWPLFSAAAQLMAVAGSFSVLASEPGMELAYWAVTQSPVIVQLAALGIGTLFHVRRQAVWGRYYDWVPPHI